MRNIVQAKNLKDLCLEKVADPCRIFIVTLYDILYVTVLLTRFSFQDNLLTIQRQIKMKSVLMHQQTCMIVQYVSVAHIATYSKMHNALKCLPTV